MKKNIVISLIGLLLACVSCEHNTLFNFKNNTPESLVVFLKFDDFEIFIPTPLPPHLIMQPNDSSFSDFRLGPKRTFKSWLDQKIYIYYYSVDTINKYGGKDIVTKDLFYQRYEVTYHDYEKMKGYFPVPPTPEMSGIRMWPPYGTYK